MKLLIKTDGLEIVIESGGTSNASERKHRRHVRAWAGHGERLPRVRLPHRWRSHEVHPLRRGSSAISSRPRETNPGAETENRSKPATPRAPGRVRRTVDAGRGRDERSQAVKARVIDTAPVTQGTRQPG